MTRLRLAAFRSRAIKCALAVWSVAQAGKLGDWDEFNAWLRMEYDADDLAEFTFCCWAGCPQRR